MPLTVFFYCIKLSSFLEPFVRTVDRTGWNYTTPPSFLIILFHSPSDSLFYVHTVSRLFIRFPSLKKNNFFLCECRHETPKLLKSSPTLVIAPALFGSPNLPGFGPTRTGKPLGSPITVCTCRDGRQIKSEFRVRAPVQKNKNPSSFPSAKKIKKV